jgi:uncharacterized protein YjbJ (UPF0337 family)
MDRLDLKEKWHEIRDKVKQKYDHLTEDDLRYEKGKEEELISRIQNKVGKTRDEVVKWLRSLK